MARIPHISVQVFPFEAGAFSPFSQSFTIFGGALPQLDTIQLEHPLESWFLSSGDHIDEYARMFERLCELALAPVDPEAAPESHDSRDSLSLIQHVMYRL